MSIYDHLGFGWGNTLLGVVALIFSAMPWLCYRYGERLRKKYGIEEPEETNEKLRSGETKGTA